MALRCSGCNEYFRGSPESYPVGYQDPDTVHTCPNCGTRHTVEVVNDITVLAVPLPPTRLEMLRETSDE